MELRWMAQGGAGAVQAASGLFDDEVHLGWAQRFLDSPGHHLCIAYEDGVPAGFVSGVELTHPDKGTEMFLYELGVDEAFQGRGIGATLVAALAELARERRCYGMWVLTDASNTAATRTYRRAGASDPEDQVMLTWRLDPAHHTFDGASDAGTGATPER